MSKTSLTTIDVTETVRLWAPGLKDFALKEFNHQNFFKTAILSITETPSLMECLQTQEGKISLLNAMKRAFSTGLSLNPQEGKAAIIAYKGKASYQIMKEGAIALILNSGDVKSLYVETVYEKDTFKITKTANGDDFEFTPQRKNRGDVDGFFCSICGKDGKTYLKYMTLSECLKIRDQYSTSFKFSKASSPWEKSEIGMCKKTVVKEAIRDLHLSPTTKALFSSEDSSFFNDNATTITVEPEKKTAATQEETAKKLSEIKKVSARERPQIERPEAKPRF